MNYIDVTIRESVYLKRGMTEEKALTYLKEYVKLMPFPEVKDVELCFLDNDVKGTLLYNELFINCAYDILNGKYGMVAVIHPDRVDLEKWNKEVIRKFKTVRFMINGKMNQHAIDIIEYLHRLGVGVSINVIYISKKDKDFVEDCIKLAEKYEVEDFCLADSCGNCLPERVVDDMTFIKEHKTKMRLNYHFHDHFGTALANALAVYPMVDIIDCSLYGIGKGGGNLSLEKIVFAGRKIEKANIETAEVLKYAKLLKFLVQDILEEDWKTVEESYINLLTGVFNRNLKEVAFAEKNSEGSYEKLLELLCEGEFVK